MDKILHDFFFKILPDKYLYHVRFTAKYLTVAADLILESVTEPVRFKRYVYVACMYMYMWIACTCICTCVLHACTCTCGLHVHVYVHVCYMHVHVMHMFVM